MNNPTAFIVSNIDKSFQVYKAIRSMEEQVLTAIDQAIRDAYPEWMGSQWKDDDRYSLYQPYQDNRHRYIALTKNEFRGEGQENGNDNPYLWLTFQVLGKDGIWKLFGLPTGDSCDDASVNIWVGKSFTDAFDQVFRQRLQRAGFQRKGGKTDPHYKAQIILSSEAVLKGLENEDWEEALKPIRGLWQAVDGAIDSSALVELITSTVNRIQPR